MEFDREKLEQEWKDLQEKVKVSPVDPKDIRRMDEITSLLMTNGESSTIKFKFLKGRKTTLGMNTKGYNHKGKVG